MAHRNYFEIDVKTHFELGLNKGKLFGDFMRGSLDEAKSDNGWASRVKRSQAYLDPTAELFPDLIQEYKGYAEAARVPFQEVWTLELDEELAAERHDRCTTVVSNEGYLVSHNEDWTADAEDSVCVLRRTVGGSTAFELFYMNGLGGNSISVNSRGIVHAIHSLVHADHQVGVPKKIIARWLSDTGSPDEAFEALRKIRRASGYHHTLVNESGAVWSIECSAKSEVLTRPALPFVHTNHFLAPELRSLEKNDNSEGTYSRHQFASERARGITSIQDAQELLSDATLGKRQSIFNQRTIARMILDVDHMTALVWLRREEKKGWVSYNLSF